MTGKRLCKGLRKCPTLDKIVSCSGLCKAVYGRTDGLLDSVDVVSICPVYEHYLDEALND